MEPVRNLMFDWEMVDPESFRGPDGSFPIAAELLMVPEYDEYVIAAAGSFPDFELVEPEDISVRTLHEWERGKEAPKPFNKLGPSDLGIRLTYFEGDKRDLVFVLSPKAANDRYGFHV